MLGARKNPRKKNPRKNLVHGARSAVPPSDLQIYVLIVFAVAYLAVVVYFLRK
jgi:hypothetical protein